MRESVAFKGFSQAQVALVFPEKKIKYQKLVKALFDVEALTADQLKDDKTFMSIYPLQENHAPNQKEGYLDQAYKHSTKVIRKIDKTNASVESQLRELVSEISKARKLEKFYLDQIKARSDKTVAGIYLDILKLTDFSQNNLLDQQFSSCEQQIDATGIHRFIVKHYKQSIAP